MSPLPRSLSPAVGLLVTALAGLLGAGCNDSIACVFTTGCQSGSGALSSNEAVPPIDGDWIVDGPPTVVGVFPSGTNRAPSTPVVVVFSESMAPASLVDAIEIVPLLSGLPTTPLAGVPQFQVGDGRVLVLLPDLLTEGDYQVQVGSMAAATDLVGQALSESPGTGLGTFSVGTTGPSAPELVTTYPPAGATGQSTTGQIVVAFDRPMRANTVTGTSLDVRVGGVDPVEDPPAVALPTGAATSDTRVYLYRSVDASGAPVSLGTGVQVELRVSVGNAILDQAGTALALQTVTFGTQAFAPPLSAALLSDPHDAIGLNNLTAGNPEELMLEVELDMLQTDDSVDLYLFGIQRSLMPDPPRIAVRRTLRLTDPGPVSSVIFTLGDLGLLLSSAPSDVRFADGPLAIAMSTRRGDLVSPVRLFDLDPDPRVIQDPILDTTAPTIADLLVPGGGLDFVTDLRGVSIAGRAAVSPPDVEALRAVEVSTPLGGNGTLTPVVGSRDEGFFLAAPVAIGLLPGGSTTYSLKAFDGAFNPSATVSGTVTQVGVVGPDALILGQDVTVHVYDAQTLEPLPGALALMHADQGDGVNYPFVQAGMTLADGRIPLLTASAPAVAAILTVDLAGYDLFTLHGVPSRAVSVPLHRSNQPSARVNGTLRSEEAGVVARLPALQQRFDDSRRDFELARGFFGVACTAAGGAILCPYGPETVLDSLLGARSFYAGDFIQSEGAFSAALLLQAFTLALPFDRVAPLGLQGGDLELALLLLDSSDPTEEAEPLPALFLRVDPGSGVDTGDLFDDPTTSGEPLVTVETRVHGLPGAIAVGPGLSYDQGGGRWRVLAARPGAVTAAGALGAALDPDSSLRMEVRDRAGNVAGARPRLSQIQAAGPDPEFRALDVPAVLAPLPGAQTAGQAFDVVLRHVIGDERGMAGLYRVRLTDEAGRGWDLWRLDPAGAADVRVRAVDPAGLGGSGLTDGDLLLEASAWAWSSLVPSSFLWTDLPREFELFAQAERQTVTKP